MGEFELGINLEVAGGDGGIVLENGESEISTKRERGGGNEGVEGIFPFLDHHRSWKYPSALSYPHLAVERERREWVREGVGEREHFAYIE